MDEMAILGLAPSQDVFHAGAALVSRGSLVELGRSEDGRLLFGACGGSGAEPYQVSADLAGEPPVTSCSCPSRKRPCKHALALLVAHAREPGAFAVREPPAALTALVEKRARGAARSAGEGASKPKKAKAPNRQAQTKKAQAQLQGVEIAERVLIDLVTAGLGSLDADRVAALRARATEIADFHLPGVALALRRLALLVENPAIEAEVRGALGARRLGQLWAMVKKGRALLTAKAEGDPPSADGEDAALLDELLGKIWQLDELAERGFVRRDVTLVELAYDRSDDPARDERVETSYLIDLGSGEVLRDVSYTPTRRVGKVPPKRSWTGALEVREAVIYPGLGNRRVRWEEDAAAERPLAAADLERVLAHAVDVAAACKQLQAQRKQLLAPDDAIMLLQISRAGRAGGAAALEDAAGARLPLAGDVRAAAAVHALELTGWPAGARALLARVAADPTGGAVVAHLMTAVAPDGLLRLSL